MATSSTPFPLQKTNYLSKDFLTLREELLAKLPLITKGKWSNLNESDPGIAMLETFFSAVDNLLFYIDMQGQELDLDRARQRVDVIRLLRLIGYEMRGVSASQGTVTIQVSPSENPNYPVTVQQGTQCTAQGDAGALTFSTTESVSLVGPMDSKTVPIFQGTNNTTTFISDGTPTQKFLINTSNVDKTTVRITVDEDPTNTVTTETWALVDSFYSSESADTNYKVQIDEYARVYIVFGDGQFGYIPAQNAIIYASFIQTDGANGNVGQNAISRISSGVPLVQDNKGNKVNLSVINSEATAGGSDIENIEEAKTTALGLLFGLNRAISRGDYEALMESIPSVTKAVAWGENEEQNPDYRLLNLVRVCFFSEAFADMYFNPASRASYRSLRDNQIRTLLTKKMPISSRLVFVDPQFVDIFVNLDVGVDTTPSDPNIVLDQVRFNILNYYNISNVVFGQDVRISSILSLANAVDGVSWAKVTRLYTTPPNLPPDTAPNPPLDLVLEKWKLPTFADNTTSVTPTLPTTVLAPYLQGLTPVSYNIGQNDITVVNPDSQSDILVGSFNYFPGPNLQHISISYTAMTDEPSPQGGYFGHPNPETDFTTYSSLE